MGTLWPIHYIKKEAMNLAVNIRTSFIGKGNDLSQLIRSILEKEILPERNIFISKDNKSAVAAAEGHEVILCDDDVMAVIRSEIVVVSAERRELRTVLAPISQCTRGRILLAVSADKRVDVDYIKDGLASGTNVAVATISEDEAGKRQATFAFSRGILPYLQEPCRDIINAVL